MNTPKILCGQAFGILAHTKCVEKRVDARTEGGIVGCFIFQDVDGMRFEIPASKADVLGIFEVGREYCIEVKIT